MIYVGFVIPIEEALRLLGLPDDFVKSFYDTEPISHYLKKKGCSLIFEYIDKGACLFGAPVKWEEEAPVEATILQILLAKREFLSEVNKLTIDISMVNINRIEEDSRPIENPQPYVISL